MPIHITHVLLRVKFTTKEYITDRHNECEQNSDILTPLPVRFGQTLNSIREGGWDSTRAGAHVLPSNIFGISFGSGISFGVRMPVISGHDPEIYEHRAIMVLENEIW